MIVKYLSKAEFGAINSNIDIKYFVTSIDVQSHTHPGYIARCIDNRMSEVGLKGTHYSQVVATWKTNPADELNDIEQKLDSGNNWTTTYRKELQQKAAELSVAVDVVGTDRLVA